MSVPCTKFLIFSFGDCAQKQKDTINIDTTMLSESIKETRADIQQDTSPITITEANQNVNIKGYTGLISLYIEQNSQIKITNTSSITSSMNNESITDFVNKFKNAINENLKLETDIGVDQSIQESVSNLRSNLINKMSTTNVLSALSRSNPVNIDSKNQNINIDFSDVTSELSKELIEKYKDPEKPIIKITQDVLSEIQNSVMINQVMNIIIKDNAINDQIIKVCKQLDSAGLGLAGVSRTMIKEVAGVAKEAVGAIKWSLIALIIGGVIALVALAWVMKSFLTNPEAIKAVGSSVSQVQGGMGGGFKFSSKHYY